MRIVTWNCNGSHQITKPSVAAANFDRHLGNIAPLRADIAILQEIPDPGRSSSGDGWIFWYDASTGRGIAVVLDRVKFPQASVIDATRSSLLVQVDGPHHFNILAIWSCPEKTSFQKYLLETRDVLERHHVKLLERPTIVAGDFNSNSCWDASTRKFSHSQLVEHLAEHFGLHSVYHSFHQLQPGHETHPTFHHYRHLDKPFHIDHCFLPVSWKLERVEVGKPSDWLDLSDHCPLVVDCGWPEVDEGGE